MRRSGSGTFGALAQYQSGGGEPERERLGEEVLWYQRLRSRLKLSLGFIAVNISIALLISGTLSNLLKEALPHQLELRQWLSPEECQEPIRFSVAVMK